MYMYICAIKALLRLYYYYYYYYIYTYTYIYNPTCSVGNWWDCTKKCL